jgi:hypothetical protein
LQPSYTFFCKIAAEWSSAWLRDIIHYYIYNYFFWFTWWLIISLTHRHHVMRRNSTSISAIARPVQRGFWLPQSLSSLWYVKYAWMNYRISNKYIMFSGVDPYLLLRIPLFKKFLEGKNKFAVVKLTITACRLAWSTYQLTVVLWYVYSV